MKIGIDASRIENDNKTGTEHYAYEVITRLIYSTENEYVLYSRQPLNLELPPNSTNKVLRFPLFWTQIRLSLEMLFHAPDILFVPAHTVPLFHPKNTVAVIHGVEYKYFPGAYSFTERWKNKLGTYFSIKWARILLTPSFSTKNDLISHYRVRKDKIRVVYPGVKELGSVESTGETSTAQGPYLLYLGRVEFRKNILRIVRAFEKLKEEKKIIHRLVLAGKEGYGFERIKQYVDNSKVAKDCVMTGYVDALQKVSLLRGASVFVFPTLYEGFGFPVLEAMRWGVPVLTSRVGGTREIAGDAALLVNPRDIDEIANSLYTLITDENLRKELISKGHDNIKKFDWDKCAKEIQELLNKKLVDSKS